MEYFIICLVSITAAGLTLFSGFGLGTLLLPAFALFFPVEIAVTLTAIVHLLNNFFKLSLFGKYADRSVLFYFGLPALFAAFFGARVLLKLSDLKPLITYSLFSHHLEILPVKLAIAVLMITFAVFELPAFEHINFEKKHLPIGGFLSGFFGGLSGHQGALRSAFLVRCGLTKESFIGTGVAIACVIDISRISVYSTHFAAGTMNTHVWLLIAATASAFLGTWLGNRLIQKVTIRFIQNVVTVMLFIIAITLGLGII